MKFINKHKMLICFIAMIVIFLLFLFIMFKQLLFNSSNDEYGNRLDGIENVEIDKKTITKIESEFKNNEKVNTVKYNLKGRLINIVFEVKDATTLDEAKTIGNKVLEYFNDEEKAYYDIQVFVGCANQKSEGYPIIGYKHKTRESIVWN